MAAASEKFKLYNLDDQIDDISDYKKDTDLDMAPQLYWRPIVNNANPLDKQLKWILKEECVINDVNNKLTIKDLGFLRGLRAAGIKDADTLINAIEKYGYIEVYEH